MKSISSLISKSDYLQNYNLIRTFKSKKNSVGLINNQDKTYVLKWFENENKKSFETELNVLLQTDTKFLKPKLLNKNEEFNFLIIEYISGENVCDIINDELVTIEEKIKIIEELASWFYYFHKYFQDKNIQYIHGDAHLRNFIFTKNRKIYGLDFEETQIGNFTDDISNLCASILTTDPKFTNEKQQLQNIFVKSYEKLMNGKIKKIDHLIDKAVKKTLERRNK